MPDTSQAHKLANLIKQLSRAALERYDRQRKFTDWQAAEASEHSQELAKLQRGLSGMLRAQGIKACIDPDGMRWNDNRVTGRFEAFYVPGAVDPVADAVVYADLMNGGKKMPNFGHDHFDDYDDDRRPFGNGPSEDPDAVPVDSGPQVTPEQAARLFEGLASIQQLELAARRHLMASMLTATDGTEDAGFESMEHQAELAMGIDPAIAQDLDDLLKGRK